jgi:DNA-binding NtrC family response regulator
VHEFDGVPILVVEDDYFQADDIAAALTRAGAVVIGPAASAEEALQLLESSNAKLALVDINLRGDASFGLADALTARQVPFIFTTGYDAGMIPARHSQVYRWQKPFDVDELISKLNEMLLPRV